MAIPGLRLRLPPMPIAAERIRTSAGTALLAREATADDLTAVNDLHNRCSAQTLLSRYHAGRNRLTVAEWDRMVDPAQGRTLVLTDPTEVVGYANVLRTAPAGPAEVSLLLRDDWQGAGVGRAIGGHLIRVARRLGFTDLVAWTEPDNVRAIALLRGVGARPDGHEPGVICWALDLNRC
ncbi:GNAT family N-acetyltransferase [Cryptosporangium sp. NPDC048952]|uniref:GNAT family N-acetyltransferase n=1 Tax=Cryptosporangium sp. NPDC048952 TaxID=3363961 RepID=UPI00372147A3